MIAELKRRKVFKVAAAYAVVGWLVIEVAATIAPQLQLPEWAPRLITFLILLGFPIALVTAWVFEVTPEGINLDAGRNGRKRVLAIAVAEEDWIAALSPVAEPKQRKLVQRSLAYATAAFSAACAVSQ